jgi:hypothetical protein
MNDTCSDDAIIIRYVGLGLVAAIYVLVMAGFWGLGGWFLVAMIGSRGWGALVLLASLVPLVIDALVAPRAIRSLRPRWLLDERGVTDLWHRPPVTVDWSEICVCALAQAPEGFALAVRLRSVNAFVENLRAANAPEVRAEHRWLWWGRVSDAVHRWDAGALARCWRLCPPETILQQRRAETGSEMFLYVSRFGRHRYLRGIWTLVAQYCDELHIDETVERELLSRVRGE